MTVNIYDYPILLCKNISGPCWIILDLKMSNRGWILAYGGKEIRLVTYPHTGNEIKLDEIHTDNTTEEISLIEALFMCPELAQLGDIHI